ncbi:MAG: phosphopyruvate hydratase [Candidatus Babeliales bacterium]
MRIIEIQGYELFDSRGFPTVGCTIELSNGTVVSASIPSGASRGKYEAVELRDGGSRLLGQGVTKAVEHINTIIAPALLGKVPNAVECDLIMLELDKNADKSHIGANAFLPVSMALFRAHAAIEKISLYELIAMLCDFETVSIPMPLFNIINGGAHATNNLQIQEYMIVPTGASDYRAGLEAAITVYHTLKNILSEAGKGTAVGDEGGFAPDFSDIREPLDFIMEAITKAGYSDDMFSLALDVAASEFYDVHAHVYQWNGKQISAQELIYTYEKLISEYPIQSIEDGLAQDDWLGWQSFMQNFGDRIHIVGDDLLATNKDRIVHALEHASANSAIIKPNQIGTITETIQAIRLCQEHGMSTIISHRSGETCDSFIADLAVGTNAGQIKAGAPARGERISKYNRLLQIEDDLLQEQEV